MVAYVAAYVAEKVKRELSRRAGGSAYAAKLDLFVGVMSMLLVAGLAFNTMWQAWEAFGPNGRTEAAQGSRLVGPALLSFSITSLAAKGGLLFLRFRGDHKPSSAHACSEACSASPATCPAGGPLGLNRQTQTPPENQPQDIFPGCLDQSPTSNEDQMHKDSLILFGVTLHLATDVIRMVLVMLVGLLLQVGNVTDVSKADAVCAWVVGAWLLLGPIGFFAAPFVQLRTW